MWLDPLGLLGLSLVPTPLHMCIWWACGVTDSAVVGSQTGPDWPSYTQLAGLSGEQLNILSITQTI